MKRMTTLATIVLIFTVITASAQEPTACGTMLESIPDAGIEELGKEYQRLKSYSNPYCDTTNSDFHKIMQELANKFKSSGSSADQVIAQMGEPYFRGSLAEYENQKVTVGRGGKMLGKALPPQFKIPAGEYYIVYLWREKDYLVLAQKAGKTVDYSWWEKGNYR